MMWPATLSNSTSLSEEASVSSGNRPRELSSLNPIMFTAISPQDEQKIKKRRNLPGNPDPEAEVIALSPKTLMATNRFICEICNKGFQRDQNLQLHRRGHNLPWKLRQRNSNEIRKRVYICPEPSCVHHHPSRALGDLTGIKKHFCRKHGEKKWKCEKCSKKYAVQSDWKAHSKTCGTREYRCDCGSIFSRKDSFVTHRAFCDALAEETARLSSTVPATNPCLLNPNPSPSPLFPYANDYKTTPNQIWLTPQNSNANPLEIKTPALILPATVFQDTPKQFSFQPSMSATALLQKAAHVSSVSSNMQSQPVGHVTSTSFPVNSLMDRFRPAGDLNPRISSEILNLEDTDLSTWHKPEGLTRDFLGLAGEPNLLLFTGFDLPPCDRDRSLKSATANSFGFSSWCD